MGSTITYQHSNLHGDIIATSVSNGAWSWAPWFDEFGATFGTPTSRLGWHGAQQRFTTSGHTGIIRMGVRLYHPLAGRFLSVDLLEGGNSTAYTFVEDPINLADLMGLCSKWDLACGIKKAAEDALKRAKEALKKSSRSKTVCRGVWNSVGLVLGPGQSGWSVPYTKGYLPYPGPSSALSLPNHFCGPPPRVVIDRNFA